MELLTYIGQATRRKDKFVDLAGELVDEYPSMEGVEGEMTRRNNALVSRLEYAKIRFSEFQRVGADDTIVSALAGVMLGDQRDTGLSDSTFAATMRSMPYLWKFYEDIQYSLDTGRIEQEGGTSTPAESVVYQSPTKYANTSLSPTDELTQDVLDQVPSRMMAPTVGKSTPATWEGVNERMSRYLVTPVYSWYSFGEMERMGRIGMKEMRRIAALDKACCKDCRYYDSLGWQPIGSLPVPGERCQCLDRCRCVMDYR